MPFVLNFLNFLLLDLISCFGFRYFAISFYCTRIIFFLLVTSLIHFNSSILLHYLTTLFFLGSCWSLSIFNKIGVQWKPLVTGLIVLFLCTFQEGNTCVSFNSSSRYLLTGGKSKTLNIWDMKTRSIKKTYKVSLFNWKITYIYNL